ncbi:ATP-binding cassette domain-containing protein [Phyllobacterium sp. LjRoot231]|uniref:ATP-binding cassette domain-containing protein n=1 Tax=Phyllobacterium sp. LjRoot231 TaxID=3342289 RepID=UPI003F5018C1
MKSVLLRGAVVALFLGAVAYPALAQDAADTIKIGVVTAESGAFVSAGHTLPAGVGLAVKEINDEGGIKVGDKTLSGGQQQMLAIARGHMARPRILLLDEPSLGLSPLLVKEIRGSSSVSANASALRFCWLNRMQDSHFRLQAGGI